MKKYFPLLVVALVIFTSCQTDLQKLGQQYQKKGDFQSLEKVMALLQTETDTATIRKILGEPIDMGFDFRYLTEKTGENDCVIGAVFHIDEFGKIDDRWVGEICE